MPAIPAGAAYNPATNTWYMKTPSPGAGGAWGPSGKVLAPSNAPPAKKTPPSKPGKTGNANWLKYISSTTKGTPGTGGGKIPYNPLAGLPGMDTLLPFPNLGGIPDGSNVQDTPSPSAKYGTPSLLDPNKFADLVGQKSYQPIIDALTKARSGLLSGVAPANSMIDSAYGDAATQDAAGGKSILAGTAQGKQTLTDLAARMAAVAGGDPTATAALGASSAQAQTQMQDLGNIDAAGQGDMAAAATRDAALAKLGYKGAVDSQSTDLLGKIGEAQSAGSQAQGKAIMDALGFNSQQKTDQLGRDAAKQDLWLAAAKAGRQLTADDLANAGTRQTLKLNKNNNTVNNWTAQNAATQTMYDTNMRRFGSEGLLKQLKASMEAGKQPPVLLALADPKARQAIGQDVLAPIMRNGSSTLAPDKLLTYIRNTLKSSYGSSPFSAREALTKLFMSQIVPQWEHANLPPGKHFVFPKGTPALPK